jgi:LPS-assembly protein
VIGKTGRFQPATPLDRLTTPSLARRFLTIGAGALALAALETTSATAAPGRSSAPAAPPAPVADDGLGPKDVYVEADEVVDDHDKKVVTATGHVEMRYQGRTLRADSVTYNSVTGVAHAAGHVVMINPDGTQEYASDATLDDQFRAGVAVGFSGRMEDNVTMVAGAAIRRSETVTELNHGVYTPCNLCKSDGKTPKTPTWSIEASKIIEDRDRRIIYYRHAIIRVLGHPILYAPIFWHPDPTAPRQSGLLAPKLTYSNNRGLSYSQPYYLDLSPSAGLTVTPQISTRVLPLLNLRYKERFYSGDIDIRLGYTYEKQFDTHNLFGEQTSRSYILGRGSFQIDPKWTVGFGAERVTDPTFFARYSVPQVYVDRGPFPTDTDRLISQVYAERRDNSSYFSAAALSFQSLRAAVLDNGVNPIGVETFDTSAAFPTATPVEGRYDPSSPVFGGRLRVTGEALALLRSNPVINVTDPLGVATAGPQLYSSDGVVSTPAPTPTAADPLSSLTYRDSRSIDAEANWRSTVTFSGGLRIQPFADIRADYFSINQGLLDRLVGSDVVTSPAESNDGRFLGSIGADFSWPFVKPIGGGSLIIEPLAQLVAANRLKFNPSIPNEDSVAFEFDETNLFSLNRFSGYDLAESGPRANLGVRASLDLPQGRSGSFLIGRTLRAYSDIAFTPQSGLRGTSSDWITAASVTPLAGVSLYNRARFDGADWTVKREEAGVNVAFGRLSASVRYVYEQSGVVQVDCTIQELTVSGTGVQECPSPFGGALVPQGSSVIGAVENMDLHAAYFFLKNWGVTFNATHDFVGFETNNRYRPVWPMAQVGFTYLDECIRLDLIYTHDEYYSATIGPSNSVAIRLTLTTLGGTLGAPTASARGSR